MNKKQIESKARKRKVQDLTDPKSMSRLKSREIIELQFKKFHSPQV